MVRSKNFEEWRKLAADAYAMDVAAYEVLERMARKLEIDDLPFTLSPRIWCPVLTWSECGQTLQEFATRVLTVKARIGPPKSVSTTRWMAAVDKPPDLIAKWSVEVNDDLKFKEIAIIVCTMAPSGCKIDPRIQPVPASNAIYAELHPECKHVLEDLEA
jgi:hypothetical protein